MYKQDVAPPDLRAGNRVATPQHAVARSSELKAFLFLTVVMVPAVAGAIIATYGLCVWIYQMFAGPPTG